MAPHFSLGAYIMKIAVIVVRVLLALPLVLFPILRFTGNMPEAEWPNEQAKAVMEAFEATGFLMDFVAITHLVTGVLLLVGRYVPLALVVHAPVTVNMVLYHALYDPIKGAAFAYVIAALHLFLICAYWPSFRQLLSTKGELCTRCCKPTTETAE